MLNEPQWFVTWAFCTQHTCGDTIVLYAEWAFRVMSCGMFFRGFFVDVTRDAVLIPFPHGSEFRP